MAVASQPPRAPAVLPKKRRFSPGAHDPVAVVVAFAGTAITLLYAIAATRIPLTAYFPSAGASLDFTSMLGPDRREPVVAYLAVVLPTFALYAVVLAIASRWIERIPRTLLFGFPVMFAAALLLMYPPTAVDLFHYHADARTLWLHGENPLIVAPQETGYPIAISWQEQPSPYGPAWSLLTAVLAPLIVFGDHLVATLIGFKLLAVASYLGCAWLIYKIVALTRPGWEGFAFVLFAWNPFVLLRVVGNGHNDLVMVFFALFALERARVRDWTLAFPLLAVSVLIKYTTGLLGLPLLLYAWNQLQGSRRERVRALAPAIGLAIAVTVIAYIPFWGGAATFDTVARQTELMITSTPDVLRSLFWGRIGEGAATDLARRMTIVVFLMLAIPFTWQARRSFDDLVLAGFNLLFFYLVIASAWFRPWYMLWPATLIALRPTRWGVALFLAITFGNAFPDLIEQYRYDWGIPPDFPARAAPVAAQFLPALVVWIVAALRSGGADPDAVDAPVERAREAEGRPLYVRSR